MKLICSAYRGENPVVDTSATHALIGMCNDAGLTPIICIGHWEGKREIAVEVTGFKAERDLAGFAFDVMERFKQDAVYVVIRGNAALTYRGGTVEWLGTEQHGVGVSLGQNCTEYLDGRTAFAVAENTTELKAA